jgi:beta-lactamase superfamily II metal-dependent hydrolase
MLDNLIHRINNYSGPFRITVHDVGHGNWNEIQFGDTRIFFDIGAQMGWGNLRVQQIINNVNIEPDDEIYIFLSHWDIDHYHSILQLEGTQQLEQIRAFFAPSNEHKTATVNRVINILSSAGIPFYPIEFTNKRNRHNKEIELNLEEYCLGRLKIYRSTRTRSKNLNSIVMHFETENNNVLFTGDQKYEKLYSYVVNHSDKNKPYIFVLPHHGGYAGKFKKDEWETVNFSDIIISYHESNRYGHPFQSHITTANSLLKDSNTIIETNGTGSKFFII